MCVSWTALKLPGIQHPISTLIQAGGVANLALGLVWRRLGVDDILSLYNEEIDYSVAPHAHGDYMFMLPEKGIMSVKDERHERTASITPRQFLIVSPRVDHSSASMISRQRHLIFYADPDVVGRAVSRLGGDKRPLRGLMTGVWTGSEHLSLLGLAKTKLEKSNRLDRRVQTAHLDYSMMLECLAIALSTPKVTRNTLDRHGAALVRQVKMLLESSIEEMPSLDRIASDFGVSRRHLTRIFAEETGDTILGYVQRLRVECAKQLLAYTRLSIIDVASSVGFQSASHFADMFRRMTALSPDQWRRQATRSS